MSELLEERKTPQPEWLDLPEEEKLQHTYWTTMGISNKENCDSLRNDYGHTKLLFINIFHNKEEAETWASIPNKYWTWNQKPAQPTTLEESMFDARKEKKRWSSCNWV